METTDKDKLLDIMRENIREKNQYLDELLTENVRLKAIIKRLQEKLNNGQNK